MRGQPTRCYIPDVNILGLNFFHANASATILVDGEVVAAAEEERFNRVKFSAGIPLASIGFCLEKAGLRFREIDMITYPRLTNTRVVNNDQIHFQDRIYKITSLYDRYRMNLKLINFKETLAEHFEIPVESLVFKLREEDHHLSHVLSGFLYSPFEEALVLSCDAFGDFVSLKAGVGRGHRVKVAFELRFPHSLGLFYTMVTQFLGFTDYGDESKIMGLSTFGSPEYLDRLRSIVSSENGLPKLDLKYFDPADGVSTSWSEKPPDISKLYNDNLNHLLGPQRQAEEEITQRHQNIAASLQRLTEESVFSIVEQLYRLFSLKNLVFAGGLAHNALLNGRICSQTPIERVFIPPGPGNSGLCLGSALASLGEHAPRREMRHAFWGSEYTTQQVETALSAHRVPYETIEDPVATAVDLLVSGKTVAWFQGRMEFGPRSLGNRCILINPILADPHTIKHRDYLKPFGISILEEKAGDYFDGSQPSPFMSFMGVIGKQYRGQFENLMLNNHCRYHTVGRENPTFHRLLSRFHEETGIPFLVNTSLNAEGEPIVESPTQLVTHLDRMNLDAAVMEKCLVGAPRSGDRDPGQRPQSS